MKKLAFLIPVVLLAVPGCSSTPKARTPEASAPAPTRTEEEKAAQDRNLINTARGLAGLGPERGQPEEPRDEWVIVTDDATGRKLQRIPKSSSLRVVDGKLRHTQLNPNLFSLDLVREDANYYYVEPPAEVTEDKSKGDEPPEGLKRIIEVDPLEYEVVTPAVSKTRLRFEEKSEGLPITGFWRSNMAVADLDGDGRPEIVTTPPRLGSGSLKIFRYAAGKWTPVEPVVESPEGLKIAYGGVSVADMDGDGRPDVVGIGHGSGPAVAINEGGFRFRLESRGLPREMSGRSVAAGDVDGDGRPDVIAVSDEPESVLVRDEASRAAANRPAGSAPPKPSPDKEKAYEKGRDARAFFAGADGLFLENNAGLEAACYGYTVALDAKPIDGGAPFYASGCRYQGGRALLYEWDRATKAFRHVGRGVVEEFSFHSGVATGTFQGKPAVFASYVKGNVAGTTMGSVRGHGLSVYYRDGATWKKQRISKVLSDAGVESQGVGAGDLNGDGLDDVVWADRSVGRVRVFFQTKKGAFEELDPESQPKFVNHSMSVRVADVDGDGRNDIVLMFEYRSSDKTRAGGLRYFRNAG